MCDGKVTRRKEVANSQSNGGTKGRRTRRLGGRILYVNMTSENAFTLPRGHETGVWYIVLLFREGNRNHFSEDQLDSQ